MTMTKPVDFKWKHYEPEMILLAVRWYLRYSLSYRDLVDMMEERGLTIAQFPDKVLQRLGTEQVLTA